MILLSAKEGVNDTCSLKIDTYATKGSRHLEISAGFSEIVSDYGKNYFNGQIDCIWYLIDDLGIKASLAAIGINGSESRSGVSLGTGFRWHFSNKAIFKSLPSTIYIDTGIGCALLDKKLPGDGSRFNFSPSIALGMGTKIRENLNFEVSIGWSHLSNANTSKRNPGLDSFGLSAGLSFSF